MSLNGLDDVKVQEAYNAAIAELGGWFLLKYTSRDEVDVLEQGTGGIVEIRNAIEKYEEQSPLFGFMRYRRRSVLLKYVPEDCSRLVIARLTVHFNAITEKFPYDTVFPIETAKELKDSKLSAACSSHTASASISSSTSSLRRRRLMEINEDEEDEDEHRAKRQSTVQEDANDDQAPTTTTTNKATDSNPARSDLVRSTSYQSNAKESDTKPGASGTNTERPSSPSKELEMRRTSTSSSRPDMYNFSSYGSSYKPKVKLGPRPSLDSNARSRGTGSSSQFRPISTLPAGLKLFGRGSKKGRERPQSQYPVAPPHMTTSSFHPSNNDETSSSLINNSRTRTGGSRPNTSSGASVRSLASPTASVFSTSSRPSTITPEKARLMKALELRKKQLNKPPTQQLPPTPVEDLHPSDNKPEASESNNDTHSGVTDHLKELSLNTTSVSPISKVSASDLTRTDSSPPSPAGTERAVSTKASSISESTDETVHATKNERTSIDEQNSAEPQVEDIEPVQSSVGSEDESNSDHIPVDADEAKLKDTEEKELPEDSTLSAVKDKSTSVDESYISKSSGIEEPTTLPDIQEEVASAEDIEPVATSTALPEHLLIATPPAESDSPSSGEPPVMSKTDMQDETIPAKEETRELKLPRSKFSLQNLKESAEVAEAETPELAAKDIEAPLENVSTEPEPIVCPVTIENLEELNTVQGRNKRLSNLAAIKAGIATPELSAANSEIDFDDDLMDELQAATVQEAQPMSVSKSPINPVFPPTAKHNPKRASISSTRNFSSPLDNSSAPFLAPEATSRPSTARSVSAASKYMDKISSQQSAPLSKKVNVGSSISQRIKALEKLNGAAPAAGGAAAPGPPTTSAAFFSVRKAGGRDGAKSPSIADDGPSPPLSRGNSTSDFGRLRARRSSSIVSASRETFSSTPPQEGAHDDAAQLSSLPSDSSLNKDTSIQRRSSLAMVKELISPRRSSFSPNREDPDSKESSSYPNTSTSALRPASSRRSSREFSSTTVLSSLSGNSMSPSSTHEDLSKPPSSHGNNSKSSITTRMLRRMSSSLSSHKNVAVSPTVREDAEPSAAAGSPSTSDIAADLGDINVQFPDTLLWKRRTLRLDTSGNMILNATQGNKENFKVIPKKYHMSEFTRPHEPDFDAQELPNSVALDFLAGGGLQFACEDRAGQMKVLSVLQESHQTWFSKGQ